MPRKIILAASAALLSLSLAACGGDSAKPSKADTVDGLVKVLSDTQEKSGTTVFDEAGLEKMSTCIVDKIYDTVDEDIIKEIAKGKDVAQGKFSDKDEEAFKKAVLDCATQL